MNRMASLIPGAYYRTGGGIYLILSFFFYLSLIVLGSRGNEISDLFGKVRHGGAADLASVFAVPAVLYASCTVLPFLSSRYERRGSRFAKRLGTNRAASAGLLVVLALMILAAYSPILVSQGGAPAVERADRGFSPPSWEHPLGTDKFGRDVMARVIQGARTSLAIALVAVFAATALGLAVGLAAGYAGGLVDDALMRITDGLIAVPRLLLLLLLVAFFTNSFGLLALLIASTSWMGVARLVRAEVLSLKERDFVKAAVATGAGGLRIVMHHLLPNTIGVVVVAATLQVGSVILLESTLSFLGLGVQPPLPSWGVMVSEGREVLASAWWVSGFPGLAIVLAVVAFNLVGDGLRDAFNRGGIAV